MSAPTRFTEKDGARNRRLAAGDDLAPLESDETGERRHVLEQRPHLLRRCPVIDGGDDFDGLRDASQVGLQLLLEVGVEHGFTWSKAPPRPPPERG